MIKSLNVAMQVRFISTGTKMQGTMQLGRIFNKVMNSDRTKKNLRKSEESPSVPVYISRGPVKATTHKNRRVTVLNKVFMKYITDFMSTGDVGSKLVSKGIEISHVNVASDYSVVNVYWFSQSGNIVDGSLQKILNASAGHLQHELTQLRVIGCVPPINFIKNKQYSVNKEVEDRLATVDFGEDYTPTAHIPKSKVPTLETSLSAELRAKISQVDGTSCDTNDDKEIYKIIIPEMRQDVMGFDHYKIMQKLMGSINKAKVAEQNKDKEISEPKGCEEPIPGVVFEFMSSEEQNKLFAEFLKKRQVEEKRKQRSVNVLDVKRQYQMDWFDRSEDDWENMEDIDINERDDYDDFSNSRDH